MKERVAGPQGCKNEQRRLLDSKAGEGASGPMSDELVAAAVGGGGLVCGCHGSPASSKELAVSFSPTVEGYYVCTAGQLMGPPCRNPTRLMVSIVLAFHLRLIQTQCQMPSTAWLVSCAICRSLVHQTNPLHILPG